VKPIRLSDHALRYISRRGFTIAEVEEAIHTVPWQCTELGRLDAEKIFLTVRNGMAKPMRQNKFARSSSKKLRKLLS
jgi:hypothetical protein